MIVYSVLRLSASATFSDHYEMFVHTVVEGSREQRLEPFAQLVVQQGTTMHPEQRAEMVRLLMEISPARSGRADGLGGFPEPDSYHSLR